MEHLERGGVLLGEQVVQGAQVLTHLDEGAPVGTAQVPQTLRRAPVHLEMAEEAGVGVGLRQGDIDDGLDSNLTKGVVRGCNPWQQRCYRKATTWT